MENQPKIFPRIKVDYAHANYAADQDKDFVGQDQPISEDIPEDQKPIIVSLGDDLLLTFGIDRGEHYELLNRKLFEVNPGLTHEQLQQSSVATMVQEIGEQIQLQGDQDDIIMITAGGNSEAALILIDDLWMQLHEMLNDDLFFCIPARDLLFVCKESNTASADKMRQLVKGVFENPESQGLLSKSIYVRRRNEPGFSITEAAF